MSKRRGTSFHGGTVQTGGQPNFPGTSVSQPMPEGPRPMQQGPVVGPEVTVGGSQPAVGLEYEPTGYVEDRVKGVVMPNAELASYRNNQPRLGKKTEEGRYRSVRNRTGVAPTQLGDYQDKGDILSPASERVPMGTTNEPIGGVAARPEVAGFIEKHGSNQQAGFATSNPSEQKDILADPAGYDARVKHKAGSGKPGNR
jgi:hypothetical protein